MTLHELIIKLEELNIIGAENIEVLIDTEESPLSIKDVYLEDGADIGREGKYIIISSM